MYGTAFHFRKFRGTPRKKRLAVTTQIKLVKFMLPAVTLMELAKFKMQQYYVLFCLILRSVAIAEGRLVKQITEISSEIVGHLNSHDLLHGSCIH